MKFNHVKKVLSLCLTCSCITAMVACNRTGTQSSFDGDLCIGVFDGAVGYEMVEQIVEMYKAENPDVEIEVRHKKYDTASLLSNMRYNAEDIYFGSTDWLPTLAKSGVIEDLTDTVTKKIYDGNGNVAVSGATKSIQDILWDEWESFCKVDVNDGKGARFYGIPNFTPVAGLSYDADLFEEKGYAVPETYDELIDLMNTMVSDNTVTPITVSGSMSYITDAAMAFWANYEGKNNFMLNTTYSGTDSNLGEINLANAYLLQQQEGRKAYLQFYYDLAHNASYTTTASRGSQTNLDAQDSFVMSIESGKRVAMIIENSFWEREAKGTIDGMGDKLSAWGWGKRNFKYMIAPVNKTTDRKTVYMSYPNSYVFVSKFSERKDRALDFLQFAHSRASLAAYTVYSGCLRPYDYTVNETEYAKATPYTQSLIDLMRRDDVDFVTMGPGNEVARYLSTDYETLWGNMTKIGSTEYRSPYQAFMAKDSLTVDDYFLGYSTYMTKSRYDEMYQKVLGEN